MIPQIVERILERGNSAQIGRVTFHQQIVQRVVHVRRELQRVVLGDPEPRHLHAEFIFDLLPRSHDVHHAGNDHAKNLSERLRQLRRHTGGIEAGALQHSGEIDRRRRINGPRHRCNRTCWRRDFNSRRRLYDRR
jgi:hypothetical protein